MDLQRLVIDDPDNPVTIDFHPGLTVAIEARSARRHRLVEELLHGLGPGRSGVHLELLDGRGHALVVFRPADARHRVIDTDAGVDLSPVYACPDPHPDPRPDPTADPRPGEPPGTRVDLLRPLGIDASAAVALLRLGANQLDGVGATDDDRRARHLAALDQGELWTMAEQLTAAEARRNAAVVAATGTPAPAPPAPGTDASGTGAPRTDAPGTGEPGAGDGQGATSRAEAAVDAARALQLAAEAHARSDSAAQAHRGVVIFGGVVAAACLVASAALVAFDQFLDDNRWTAKVLLVLGLLALGLALWDRRGVRAVRRHERRLLASLGAPSYEAMRARAGPLADDRRRNLLLDAAAAYDSTAAQWRLLTGGIPLQWALDHRPAVTALAERRARAAPFLATDLAREESPLADAARLLVERVGTLRHVGLTRERLPLILDEPFIGLDAGDTVRLLETVRRLAAFHQVLLVTGNPEVEAWATRLASSGQLSMVRPESSVPTTGATAAGGAPEPSRAPSVPEDGAAATPSASSSVNAPS